jgi:hypothetical protein
LDFTDRRLILACSGVDSINIAGGQIIYRQGGSGISNSADGTLVSYPLQ